LFGGLAPGERVYFVHSYAAVPDEVSAGDPSAHVTTATHGVPFVAAVEARGGALVGMQFHPEKSGDVGARLLRAWVEYVASAALMPARSAGPASPAA
jgi:glutamine amidotransferase